MTIINICMCGASAGYPHRRDCPYPLFRGTPGDEEQWLKDRNKRRRKIDEFDKSKAGGTARRGA